MKITPFIIPLNNVDGNECEICHKKKTTSKGYWMDDDIVSSIRSIVVCDDCIKDEDKIQCVYSIKYLL